MKRSRHRGTLKERLDRKWKECPETGCWLWTGRTGRTDMDGYGRLWVSKHGYRGLWTSRYGGPTKAHRVSFVLYKRMLAPGEYVLHRCDNRACVNPDHLYAGDHSQNMRDMLARGRSLRGERHPRSKLTDNKVREIRALYASGKRTACELAKKYRVDASQVCRIARREAWAHVPDEAPEDT
jgi:hypothetical protein